MWKICVLLAAATVPPCTGCASFVLKEYTLQQAKSAGEGRDSLVLRALATVAANPDALPSFALYSSGITTITDSATLNFTDTWAPFKYLLYNLGFTVSASPKGQWTVDPTVEYQQLQAMHAACLWALFGPECAARAYPTGILGDPQQYLDGKPHFGVEKRLSTLRPGWVQIGRLQDVPHCARFKAHKGKTWVWVMPQDSESFAQFTLVLQDIATLDAAIIASPPILVQLTTVQTTSLPDPTAGPGGNKNVAIKSLEIRAVKKEYKELIEKAIQAGISAEEGKTGKVNLTWAEWMAYTEPWAGVRGQSGSTPTTPSPASTSMSVAAPTGVLLTTPNPAAPSLPPTPSPIGPLPSPRETGTRPPQS